jgi:dolichol-phosphate mannosyltransferase
VILPTYNEAENILQVIQEIRRNIKDPEIIVVDDNSPDGTFKIVKDLQAKVPNLKILKRREKLGVGSAVKQGYDMSSGKTVIFMDADLSHNPSDLPNIRKELKDYDLVICSRFVKGGGFDQDFFRSKGTPTLQRVLSRMVNANISDLTNGFMGLRRRSLEKVLDFYNEIDMNPFIDLYQFPIILAAERIGLDSIEIPTHYIRRRLGNSKVNSVKTALETFKFFFSFELKSLKFT